MLLKLQSVLINQVILDGNRTLVWKKVVTTRMLHSLIAYYVIYLGKASLLHLLYGKDNIMLALCSFK
jgi:hypothetical protein